MCLSDMPTTANTMVAEICYAGALLRPYIFTFNLLFSAAVFSSEILSCRNDVDTYAFWEGSLASD